MSDNPDQTSPPQPSAAQLYSLQSPINLNEDAATASATHHHFSQQINPQSTSLTPVPSQINTQSTPLNPIPNQINVQPTPVNATTPAAVVPPSDATVLTPGATVIPDSQLPKTSQSEDERQDEEEEEDEEEDEEDKIVEKSSTGRFHKRNKRFPRQVPGTDNAFVAIEPKSGKEVVWNEIELPDKKTELENRFLSVVKKLKKNYHPFLVRFLDAWVAKTESGTRKMVFVVERLDDATLKQFMCNSERSNRLWKRHVGQMLSVLKFLRQAGVMHGNLTNETVYYQSSGNLKVGTFSIMGLLNQTITSNTTLPKHTKYHAPEYSNPDAKITPAVDIYALGILALELIVWDVSDTSLEDRHWKEFDQILGRVTNTDHRDFIRLCLQIDPEARPSLNTLMNHPAMIEVPTLKLLSASVIVESMRLNTEDVHQDANVSTFSTLLRDYSSHLEDDTVIAIVEYSKDSTSKTRTWKDFRSNFTLTSKYLEDVKNNFYPFFGCVPPAQITGTEDTADNSYILTTNMPTSASVGQLTLPTDPTITTTIQHAPGPMLSTSTADQCDKFEPDSIAVDLPPGQPLSEPKVSGAVPGVVGVTSSLGASIADNHHDIHSDKSVTPPKGNVTSMNGVGVSAVSGVAGGPSVEPGGGVETASTTVEGAGAGKTLEAVKPAAKPPVVDHKEDTRSKGPEEVEPAPNPSGPTSDTEVTASISPNGPASAPPEEKAAALKKGLEQSMAEEEEEEEEEENVKQERPHEPQMVHVSPPGKAPAHSALFTHCEYSYVGCGRWQIYIQMWFVEERLKREGFIQVLDFEWHNIEYVASLFEASRSINPDDKQRLLRLLDCARHSWPLIDGELKPPRAQLANFDAYELHDKLILLQQHQQAKEVLAAARETLHPTEGTPHVPEATTADVTKTDVTKEIMASPVRHESVITSGQQSVRDQEAPAVSTQMSQDVQSTQPVPSAAPTTAPPPSTGAPVGPGVGVSPAVPPSGTLPPPSTVAPPVTAAPVDNSSNKALLKGVKVGQLSKLNTGAMIDIGVLAPRNHECAICDKHDYLHQRSLPAYLTSPCYHCRESLALEAKLTPETFYDAHLQHQIPWPGFLQVRFGIPQDDRSFEEVVNYDCRWRSRSPCKCMADGSLYPPCVEFPWLYETEEEANSVPSTSKSVVEGDQGRQEGLIKVKRTESPLSNQSPPVLASTAVPNIPETNPHEETPASPLTAPANAEHQSVSPPSNAPSDAPAHHHKDSTTSPPTAAPQTSDPATSQPPLSRSVLSGSLPCAQRHEKGAPMTCSHGIRFPHLAGSHNQNQKKVSRS